MAVIISATREVKLMGGGLNGVDLTGPSDTGASRDAPARPTIEM
jgi:hypothetical protein